MILPLLTKGARERARGSRGSAVSEQERLPGSSTAGLRLRRQADVGTGTGRGGEPRHEKSPNRNMWHESFCSSSRQTPTSHKIVLKTNVS